jgi:hypothetical protein
LLTICGLASTRIVLAQTAQTAPVNSTAAVLAGFSKRVNDYVAMHKRLADRFSELEETKSQAEIAKQEKALGDAIRAARATAKPGDILTRRTVAIFKKLIAQESSGMHGSQVELRAVLEPLFLKYGVDAVFAGHEHFYERIKPQKGIQYFTSGGAAKLRDDDIRSTGLTAKGFDSDRSFMLVEIAGNELFFQTITRQVKRSTREWLCAAKWLNQPRAPLNQPAGKTPDLAAQPPKALPPPNAKPPAKVPPPQRSTPRPSPGHSVWR